MNIYFSSTTKKSFSKQNKKIIEELKKYGNVLTEHLGVYGHDNKRSLKFIYKRDMEWLKKTDIVIAEISNHSLGVGYELGIAEKLKKKIFCLYNSKKRLSAMILGNPYNSCKKYEKLSEIDKILKKDIFLAKKHLK